MLPFSRQIHQNGTRTKWHSYGLSSDLASSSRAVNSLRLLLSRTASFSLHWRQRTTPHPKTPTPNIRPSPACTSTACRSPAGRATRTIRAPPVHSPSPTTDRTIFASTNSRPAFSPLRTAVRCSGSNPTSRTFPAPPPAPPQPIAERHRNLRRLIRHPHRHPGARRRPRPRNRR